MGEKATVILGALLAFWLSSGVAASEINAPDPSLTPGATAVTVTAATVQSTICRAGYAHSFRNVSVATRSQVFARYRVLQRERRRYVIDHLVPLEVGGSNAITNLWPQVKEQAKQKDDVERTVHLAVCSGSIALAPAQAAFESDWASAITSLRISKPSTAPSSIAGSPTTLEQSTGTAGATALCRDGTYSFAEHHEGACARHRGIAVFYR